MVAAVVVIIIITIIKIIKNNNNREGPIHQVITRTKQPSSALGSWFGPGPGRNTVS